MASAAQSPTARHWLLFALGLASIAALYWPGLRGGFVLDDMPNLAPIRGYLRGELAWQGVVLSNGSGVLGRPLSMLTLLANTAWAGLSPSSFKLTNLLLHGVCALLATLLTLRVLRQSSGPGAAAWSVAVGIAWAALPIHADTVLYVIQRMAILSALFTLLALWLYCVARERMRDGRPGAPWLLWLAVPLATAAAMLSKENGALVPVLALVIELGLFRASAGGAGRRTLAVWYTCFLALPALLALVLVALRPASWLDYAGRPFTLYERLLTELRVLWDYVGAILLPSGARLGLMHDDFPVSSGWLTPATTLVAAIAWMLALAAASQLARRGRPLALVGLLFFLGGHLLESTVFPLELHFEHRNYLPALGLIWTVAAIAFELLGLMRDVRVRRLCGFGLAAAAGACALSLLAQTSAWRDNETLLRTAVSVHPRSERAHAELAALLASQGRSDEAIEHLRVAARLQPEAASAYALGEALAACQAGSEVDPAIDARVVALASDRLPLPAANIYTQLAEQVEGGHCGQFGATRLIAIGGQWLARDRSVDPGSTWQIHYRMARLQAAAGDAATALPHAVAAWTGSGHELRVGILALQLYTALGDREGGRRQLAALRAVDRGWDPAAGALLRQFQSLLEGAANGATDPPGRS